MQRILLFFVAVLPQLLSAQVVNGGFELWSVNPSYYHPVDENTVFTSSNAESFFSVSVPTLTQVQGNGGGSALRVESIEVDGVSYGGYGIWGNSPTDDSMIFSEGFVFSGNTLTALSADVRYQVNNDSPAFIFIQFKYQGNPVGLGNAGTGMYFFQLSGDQPEWESTTWPINLGAGVEIDECIIAITSNNLLEDPALLFEGDFLEVDNLSFVGTSEAIPGGDFENWFPVASQVNPIGWEVFFNPFVPLYQQSSDAYSGNYALQLNTIDGGDGFAYGSFAAQGTLTELGILPSIPVDDSFYGISYAYKYLPQNVDSGLVVVGMSQSANPDPEEVFFWTHEITASPEYQVVNHDLSSITSIIDVNYITIAFVSSNDNSEIPGGNIPQAGTVLLIDAIDLLDANNTCNFSVSIAQGADLILCPGTSEILNVESGYDAYQWYRTDSFSGETEMLENEVGSSITILPETAAGYSYWCEATLDGCTEASNTIFIDMWVFAPAVIASSDDVICDGETVLLEAIGPLGTYQWFQDGNPLNEPSALLEVTESGTYTVEISPILCPNVQISSGIGPTITVNPTPQPIISGDEINLDFCLDQAYESMEWFLCESFLSSNQCIEFAIDGGSCTLYAIVTNEFGCSATSEIIDITGGVDNLTALEELAIFPNPTTSVVQFETEGIQTVRVFNEFGQLVLTSQANGLSTIDVSSLASGMYLFIVGNKKANVLKQ
ncbi:MAG: hypothetical protein RL226_1055 [Bacteroidota bacterium]